MDLPIRRFSVLPVPVDELRVPDLLDEETNGDLPVIEVAMREVRPDELPNVEIRSEPAAGCWTSVGAEDPAVPIDLPIRDPDVPMREFERLSELAAGCLATVGADGLSMRVELGAPGCEPGADLSIRIERPIRDVRPVSIP